MAQAAWAVMTLIIVLLINLDAHTLGHWQSHNSTYNNTWQGAPHDGTRDHHWHGIMMMVSTRRTGWV